MVYNKKTKMVIKMANNIRLIFNRNRKIILISLIFQSIFK